MKIVEAIIVLLPLIAFITGSILAVNLCRTLIPSPIRPPEEKYIPVVTIFRRSYVTILELFALMMTLFWMMGSIDLPVEPGMVSFMLKDPLWRLVVTFITLASAVEGALLGDFAIELGKRIDARVKIYLLKHLPGKKAQS